VDEPLSLDPGVIEQAYAGERIRRARKRELAVSARVSNGRFWVMLAVLSFFTVCFTILAWNVVHETFGI
jgi:hypothetical protein